MKIKELIKKLQTFNGELEIIGYVNEELGVIDSIRSGTIDERYTKSGYIPDGLENEKTYLFIGEEG